MEEQHHHKDQEILHLKKMKDRLSCRLSWHKKQPMKQRRCWGRNKINDKIQRPARGVERITGWLVSGKCRWKKNCKLRRKWERRNRTVFIADSWSPFDHLKSTMGEFQGGGGRSVTHRWRRQWVVCLSWSRVAPPSPTHTPFSLSLPLLSNSSPSP